MDFLKLNLPQSVRARGARDGLRRLAWAGDFDSIQLAEAMSASNAGFDADGPGSAAAWCASRGLIEPTSEGRFALTLDGRSAAAASLRPRLPPDKAWERLAKALVRARALSESDAFPERWAGAIVFGSLLRGGADSFGDADYALVAASDDARKRASAAKARRCPELFERWMGVPLPDESQAADARFSDPFLSPASPNEFQELAEAGLARGLWIPFASDEPDLRGASAVALAKGFEADDPASAAAARTRLQSALNRLFGPTLASAASSLSPEFAKLAVEAAAAELADRILETAQARVGSKSFLDGKEKALAMRLARSGPCGALAVELAKKRSEACAPEVAARAARVCLLAADWKRRLDEPEIPDGPAATPKPECKKARPEG